MKGLLRSLSRAPESRQLLIKREIAVSEVVTVSATGTAIGFGTAVIGNLPEGNLVLLATLATLAFAGSGSDDNLADDWSGDFSLGTTPADDATISGADVDLLASTALDTASSEVHAAARYTNVATAIIDNTAGTGEVNLNILIDAADITDDESVDITVTGTVYLLFTVLGDD